MGDKKYQVFISSTYEDLKNERKSIIEAILMTGNIPVGMESFVAASQEQFEYIKNCISSCDYYILVVGGRYGSLHPVQKLSYTELEFDYAKSLHKPILVFMYNDINNCEKKDGNLENINRFRNKIQEEHLCQFFNDKLELKGLVLTALNQEITKNPQVGWVRGDKNISKFKNMKECIQDLIKTGEGLHSYAVNHLQQSQRFGIYAGAFGKDYDFRVWMQKIKEFITLSNISLDYLYVINGNTPYVDVIKYQLVSLKGLLAKYEYEEILK